LNIRADLDVFDGTDRYIIEAKDKCDADRQRTSGPTFAPVRFLRRRYAPCAPRNTPPHVGPRRHVYIRPVIFFGSFRALFARS
jgi:hypothetical protein